MSEYQRMQYGERQPPLQGGLVLPSLSHRSPGILFLHGGRYGRGIDRKIENIQQRFANFGFASFAPNLSGSGGNFTGATLADRSIDAKAAWNLFKEYADPSVVLAVSMGTHAALNLDLSQVKKLILVGPFIYPESVDDNPLSMAFTGTLRRAGENIWGNSSDFDRLANFQGEVLILYGKDEIVPPGMQQRVEQTIRKNGKIIHIKGGGHNLLIPKTHEQEEAKDRALDEIARFLQNSI